MIVKFSERQTKMIVFDDGKTATAYKKPKKYLKTLNKNYYQMNKLNIIKLLSLLIFMGAFLFLGCEKNEETGTQSKGMTSTQNDYYSKLSAETNVDVRKLAASPELQKFFEAVSPISQELTESIARNTSLSKSLTEEEKIARANELVTLITLAVENNDFDSMDLYYKELLFLLYGHTIQCEDFNTFLHSELITKLNEEAQIFNDFLSAEYPSFFTLNSEQQQSIVDAIIEIPYENAPPRSCEQVYADDIRSAEAQYAITTVGCAFLTAGAWLCVGVALGIYCVQHNSANKDLADCIAKRNG